MFPCEIKEQASQPTLSVRFRASAPDMPRYLGRIYAEIIQYLGELGEPHTGAAFAAYYNLDMQDLDVEAGFSVSRQLPGKGDMRPGEIPGGLVALCHYTGPYDEVGPAYEALMQFVQSSGYKAGGVSYEWFLNGPDVSPQDLKTDIVFPVTRLEGKVTA